MAASMVSKLPWLRIIVVIYHEHISDVCVWLGLMSLLCNSKMYSFVGQSNPLAHVLPEDQTNGHCPNDNWQLFVSPVLGIHNSLQCLPVEGELQPAFTSKSWSHTEFYANNNRYIGYHVFSHITSWLNIFIDENALY